MMLSEAECDEIAVRAAKHINRIRKETLKYAKRTKTTKDKSELSFLEGKISENEITTLAIEEFCSMCFGVSALEAEMELLKKGELK